MGPFSESVDAINMDIGLLMDNSSLENVHLRLERAFEYCVLMDLEWR